MAKNACKIITLIFSLCLCLQLFANGNSEGGQTASGRENWEAQTDLSTQKPGKYNIIITGKDRAGNVSYGGPINIFIDPKSDLPQVGISNPLPGMRVGGDLNVVGTCVDDDKVDYVEIQIDGGEWVRAKGQDFWSYYLDGKLYPDGRHSIKARGVDVNGKVGLEKVSYFDLDRNKPVSLVDSMAAGVLVAGAIKLNGVASDANGIAELYASVDEGKSFKKLAISPNKAKDGWRFQVPIDTKKFKDGPFVVWFKSRDRVGSLGLSPFLLFIDNTKPVVELLSPKPEESVNGGFDAVIRAYDLVGLASISWKYGADQGGTFEVRPGNPYFTASLKAPGGKANKQALVVTAKDSSGNVSVFQGQIKIDNDADMPQALIQYPASAAQLQGDFVLSGQARDDDGVASVSYKLDGQAPVSMDTSGAFRFEIKDLAVGKHIILVTAQDINGLAGPAVKLEVTQAGKAPRLSLVSLSSLGPDKKPQLSDFRAGIEVAPDAQGQLLGKLYSPAKAVSLSYSLGQGPAQKLALAKSQGEISFSIPLPDSGPYGLLDVSLGVQDEFGRSDALRSFVYITDYSRIRREPDFDYADARVSEDGRVALGGSQDFTMLFLGEEIAKAELVPPSPIVSLSRDGSIIRVKAVKEGQSQALTVKVVTVKNHSFSSKPFIFVSDDKPPEFKLDALSGPPNFNKEFTLKGQVSDGDAVASLNVRLLPDGIEQKLPVQNGRFEYKPNFPSLGQGPGVLELSAIDPSGNQSKAYFSFIKDTEAPTLISLSPVEAEDINLSLAGLAQDPSGVREIEFAADGKGFSPISQEAFFSHAFNPMQASKASYRLTDALGNQAVVEAPHFLNPTPITSPAKGPALAILSPQASAQLGREAYLVVKAVAPSGLSSLQWVCEGQKGEFDVSAGPVWVARIPLEGLKAKTASVLVTAVDSAKQSTKAQVSFAINPQAQAPSLELQLPAESAVVKGPVQLVALAKSQSGVASMAYSLDGGEFKNFEGMASLALNLGELSPGTHSISIKATASGGIESSPLKRSFKVLGPAPSLSLAFASGKDAAQDYSPGMTWVIKDSRILGTLHAENGLGDFGLSLEGGQDLKPTIKKSGANDASFEASLPASLPFERIGLVARASDAQGLKTEYRAFFHRVSPPAESRQDEGIYALDDRVVKSGSPMEVRLAEAPLNLRFVGRPIASVSLSPDQAGLATLSFNERLITVEAGKEGIGQACRLVVKTVDGDSFEWGPLVLVVDRDAPGVGITLPSVDQWVSSGLKLECELSDANGIASAEWSLDGQAWNKAAFDTVSGKLNLDIPLESYPDGAMSVFVKAVDRSGRETVADRSFNKDATKPLGAITGPRAQDPVNGFISFSAQFGDPNGNLDVLEFSTDGKTWEKADKNYALSRDVELSKVGNDPAKILFRARDRSGNVSVIFPECKVDGESDLPVVTIQLPQENEVLRSDFTISGVVTDDDGLAAVYYKIDGGAEQNLKMDGYSFSIPIALADTTDNEHRIEMYAEDIFGVKGKLASLNYRISKAEPIASMANPPIEHTVRGVVNLSGDSSDANGIANVRISVDNALSFNLADGAEAWTYRLDTRSLADGLHSVYVKPLDKYDTEGFFASLINIDNTDPEIALDQPSDGSTISGVLQASGRVFDNVAIKSVRLEFARILGPNNEAVGLGQAGQTSLALDLGTNQIITQAVDIANLEEGVYNLRVRVTDKADNEALATRTVTVVRKKKTDTIDIMFPLKGESVHGEYTVHGIIRAEKPISSASIYVDAVELKAIDVDENGYFSYAVSPAEMVDGAHKLQAKAISASGETIASVEIPINYTRDGAWISFDTFDYGQYLPKRPYIKGRVGWFDENFDARDKKEKEQLRKDRKVVKVEISRDNGKTYATTGGSNRWSYRLETLDYPEGQVYLIVKASFADGSVAYAKTILNLDKTPPTISLLAPRENERLNESVKILGTANDETGLGDIDVKLRKGDKSGYSVPSFIQGLFFDAHFMGSTMYELGAGLTFFDNNVKLMGYYGMGPSPVEGETPPRFGGQVLGAKLLANIFYFPFSFVLGPDWEWLSSSFALGAAFSYFSQTSGEDSPLTLASVIAQLEFPGITFNKLKAFRRYSLYTEFQMWLISSDVEGGLEYRLSFGARINLF